MWEDDRDGGGTHSIKDTFTDPDFGSLNDADTPIAFDLNSQSFAEKYRITPPCAAGIERHKS